MAVYCNDEHGTLHMRKGTEKALQFAGTIVTHVDDISHILAVRVLAKVGRSANDDVEAVDTRLDGQSSIVHVAPDVGENLGLEAKLADRLAVLSGLLGGGGRGKFDVVDAKVIEGPGNLDLGLGVEEGVGELLALAEGRLDWRRTPRSVDALLVANWRRTY